MSVPDTGTQYTAVQAARRAARWAAAEWRREPDVSDAYLVEALSLLQICIAVDPGDGVARELAAQIGRAAAKVNFAAADVPTALLAATLGRSCGLASRAAEYLALLGEVRSAANGPTRLLIAIALDGIGAVSGRGEQQLDIDARTLRTGPPADLGAALSRIEEATAFGMIRVHSAPPFPALLGGAAVACLRAYDLPLAMRVLRAARYLDDEESEPALRIGHEFIACNLCEDGSFGDVDAAVARLASLDRRSDARTLKTALTSQATWTAALLEDRCFSLFERVFGRVGILAA